MVTPYKGTGVKSFKIETPNINIENLFDSFQSNGQVNLELQKASAINDNLDEVDCSEFLAGEKEKAIYPGRSSNIYSDKDNIYINKLSNIMNEIQNEFGEENYKIFSEYIRGKKLSDIVDENGHLLDLTDLA